MVGIPGRYERRDTDMNGPAEASSDPLSLHRVIFVYRAAVALVDFERDFHRVGSIDAERLRNLTVHALPDFLERSGVSGNGEPHGSDNEEFFPGAPVGVGWAQLLDFNFEE